MRLNNECSKKVDSSLFPTVRSHQMSYICHARSSLDLKVYQSVREFEGVDRPIVTTGTFDGIHVGHHHILSRLKEIASEVNGETVLLTFSPHPRMVLFPDDHGLKLLNTREEQIEQLAKCGVDHLIIQPFTIEFAQRSALDYVRELLVEGIGVHTMVVGYDHRFGKGREGNFTLLNNFAEMFNFNIEEIPAQMIKDTNVSSTKIRNAIASGDIFTANSYLGYNYPLAGIVIEGDGIGRTIGFPTANLQLLDELKIIPATGVYAVKVIAEGKHFNGMLNIGKRPTVTASDELRIEVHLIDASLTLYGQEIQVEFVQRIRDEKKFGSKEELIQQLEIDKTTALGTLVK